MTDEFIDIKDIKKDKRKAKLKELLEGAGRFAKGAGKAIGKETKTFVKIVAASQTPEARLKRLQKQEQFLKQREKIATAHRRITKLRQPPQRAKPKKQKSIFEGLID